MKKLLGPVAVAVAVLLAGCNTFEGLGKDIKAAGQKIEESSRKR